MRPRTAIKRLLEKLGYSIQRIQPPSSQPPPSQTASWFDSGDDYVEDGLRTIHNHDFARDPGFLAAYQRGVQAAGEDYRWRWRVHVGLWVANAAVRLRGDFVECGVNRGCLSSAIMSSLNWDSRGKRFYLLDTFSGVDEGCLSEAEKAGGAVEQNRKLLASGFYVSSLESVRANFSEWKNARIIQGRIPDTLPQVDAAEVAYLHLDMNCARPEVAAAEFFWPRLVGGAFLLLDDYAYYGYRPQKLAMDDFAKRQGVGVLALPTGQGLIVKPPAVS